MGQDGFSNDPRLITEAGKGLEMAKFILQVLLIDVKTSHQLSSIRRAELVRSPHGKSGQSEVHEKVECMFLKGQEPDTQGLGQSPSGIPDWA